ncbi:DNA repair ATPase RecN [Paenibacillus mucilaginosus]|uniref:hypothetical protein n=1 Tax=Paenibacillus mucilaginosus TaxID=61624 RepID=UPI003D24683D
MHELLETQYYRAASDLIGTLRSDFDRLQHLAGQFLGIHKGLTESLRVYEQKAITAWAKYTDTSNRAALKSIPANLLEVHANQLRKNKGTIDALLQTQPYDLDQIREHVTDQSRLVQTYSDQVTRLIQDKERAQELMQHLKRRK